MNFSGKIDSGAKRAQNQVKMDINSARVVYDQKIDNIKFLLQLTAKRGVIVKELKQCNTALLKRMLEEIRIDNNLDFLSLTDKRGIALVRSRYPYRIGDDQSNNEMVSKALNRELIAGTQILSQEELIEEGDGLAEQAFMLFVPTRIAKQRARDRETSGMVIEAAIPVIDKNDDLIGVIYGGILLSRNYGIVDRIKDTVYRGESYEGIDVGTATIFQWDVRISQMLRI